MKIGILGDTHGNGGRTATAADVLATHGVSAVFHCGDIGNEDVLTELIAVFELPQVPVYCVFGNCDYPPDFSQFPANTVVQLRDRFAEVEIGGASVAVAHGDDAVRLRAAIQSGKYDYVLTGHTHRMDDTRHGTTRVINPGAVHRAADPTVAVLDLQTDTLSYIPILDTTLV
jgi:putative phosphoesterase